MVLVSFSPSWTNSSSFRGIESGKRVFTHTNAETTGMVHENQSVLRGRKSSEIGRNSAVVGEIQRTRGKVVQSAPEEVRKELRPAQDERGVLMYSYVVRYCI